MIADVSVDELIFAAALACKRNVEQEPIDKAICDAPGADASELDRYAETKFVPFDPIRKRTEATLCGPDGSVFSVSKGSPQVICDLVDDKEMRARVLAVVDEYAARGFRTLGVARTKKGRDDSSWEFLGVLSLYDPPRHDTADTVVNAMALGNEVKMITGDHIAIAKETARQLGLGENIVKPEVFAHHEELGGAFAAQYGDFIENADGFAEVMPEHTSHVTRPPISRPMYPHSPYPQVMPEHKFAIVDVLQQRKHTVGMTGDGVNDAPALKQANIGIAVQGATDAARAAADIVLMAPGLSVIIHAIVLSRQVCGRRYGTMAPRLPPPIATPAPHPASPLPISRQIFQRMKNYCTYRIACTIQILFFFFIAIIWNDFQIPVFVICLISILNDGTIISIAYDSVMPSQQPEAWDLPQTVGISATIGLAGVCSTMFLLYLAGGAGQPAWAGSADFFHLNFGLPSLAEAQVQALIYLQLSIGGQATIFVARTRSFFFTQRPGALLFTAFCVAQTISTLICVFLGYQLSPMIGLGMKCDLTQVDPVTGIPEVNLCTERNEAGVDCASTYCTSNLAGGWAYAGLVWAYCAIWFLIQDGAKLIAITLFDMSDPEKAARRREKMDRKILMGRLTRSTAAGSRRTTQHTVASEARASSIAGYSQSGATAEDLMLAPARRTTGDIRQLPNVVERLEQRVRELEDALSKGGRKSK